MGLVQGAGQETKQRREMGLGDVRSSEGDEEQLARDGVIRKAMSTLSPPLSLALGGLNGVSFGAVAPCLVSQLSDSLLCGSPCRCE